MKSFYAFFFFCTISFSSFAQDNTGLNEKLEDIHSLDQNIRLALNNSEMNLKKDSLIAEMRTIDTQNQKYIGHLLDSIGWPSDLSFNANMAIFLVIQHAGVDYMSKYANYVEDAYKKNLVPIGAYVVFVDRMKMYSRKPQVYGSQIIIINNVLYMWPIEDAENLAARRNTAGLPSIEDYMNGFGKDVVWDKNTKIEDLRKLDGYHFKW